MCRSKACDLTLERETLKLPCLQELFDRLKNLSLKNTLAYCSIVSSEEKKFCNDDNRKKCIESIRKKLSKLMKRSNLQKWFIGIWIRCQQIPMKSYSVTFDYS